MLVGEKMCGENFIETLFIKLELPFQWVYDEKEYKYFDEKEYFIIL